MHELLHTVRIETWENQTPDTELIRVGKEYQTTENTHTSIYQNILMYGFHVIDGVSLKDRLNEGESLNQISPDQLKLMLQEIDLQKQGYGVHNYDSEKSAEENAAEYEEKVFYYWLDVPKLKE